MSNSIQPTSESMEIKFFYEDVIYRLGKKGNLQLGMVTENAEFASSDEESSDDEEEKLQKGTIRVAWHPSGDEQVVKEAKVGLADRSLMPGDVVRRLIKGKETQRGYCRHVDVHASCKIVGTSQVIHGIGSKDLISLDQFAQDVAVCLDEWVGMIRHIKSTVTVKFVSIGKGRAKQKVTEGQGKEAESICTIADIIAEELEDTMDKRDDDCEFRRYNFYEGQTLAGPLKLFEEATFISITDELSNMRKFAKYKNKMMRVVVTKVETEALSIQWQCRAMNTAVDPTSEIDSQQPSDYIAGDDLKRVRMLNAFEPCTLQLGDRHFYTLKQNDIIMVENEWKKLEKDSISGGKIFGLIRKKSPSESQMKSNLLENNISSKNIYSNEILVTDLNEDAANLICKDTKDLTLNTAPIENGNHPTRSANSDGSESDDEKYTSDSSEDETKANAKDLKNKTESVTSSVNVATVQSTASTGTQISTRGQKKKKKVKKMKKVKEIGVNISPPKCITTDQNIVKPGDKVVVETLLTHSEATVVWQDGVIEKGIPSRELFPILHLDEQEFFSGDYVIRSKSESGEDGIDPHCYGVIQRVDHFDRICVVHWYLNYTTESTEAQPKFCGKTEEPVYDLKDHPDFKYRPGSIVIRVANFSKTDNFSPKKDSEETISGSGGQVLDNYPSGKILVWWPNNQTSECWPQDLYKIGEYDSDEGELWEDDDDDISEASWETASEHSMDDKETPDWSRDKDYEEDVEEYLKCSKETLDDVQKNATHIFQNNETKAKLALNIERARTSMVHLEEIFQGNPTLQNTTVMKQLLDVYKGCKTLDKLMETTFFEEKNFDGLIEKLKDFLKYPQSGHQQALHEQFTRLFSVPVQSEESKEAGDENMEAQGHDFETGNKTDSTTQQQASIDSAMLLGDQIKTLENNLKNQASQDIDENIKKAENMANRTCSRLCSLMKAQLLKSHEEVINKYGGQSTVFTQDDLEQIPGEEEAELDEIMNQIMKNTSQLRNSTNVTEEPKTPDGKGSGQKLSRGVSNFDISTALHGTPEQKKIQENETKARLDLGSNVGDFSMAESAPNEHRFKLAVFQPHDPKSFIKFVRKELQLLKSSLPSGIFVKGFEDRMDLYSVMIKGPDKTPYEDGLFFFDFQLPSDYPKAPPLVNYISFVPDKLNPNLYEDGKVCVSLLGTWGGKGTETWTPNSNMLQLLVSIQGLILVPEPYYNEAGYERQKGTQQGVENSRMYNELAILKMTQSLNAIAKKPVLVFKDEILQHFQATSDKFVRRLEAWLEMSELAKSDQSNTSTSGELKIIQSKVDDDGVSLVPQFPLLPGSKGFCISMRKAIATFKETIQKTKCA